MPQWASILWARLENLIGDLGSICIKVISSSRWPRTRADLFVRQVYTLEKILKLKRDQSTQASFLDEAMSVSDLVWRLVAEADFLTRARCSTISQVSCFGPRFLKRSRLRLRKPHEVS